MNQIVIDFNKCLPMFSTVCQICADNFKPTMMVVRRPISDLNFKSV